MVENFAGDFLRRKAVTAFNACRSFAGIDVKIETNYEPILQMAVQYFGAQPASLEKRKGIQFRIWIESAPRALHPSPKPFFRGLGHLVFAGFDNCNSFLINLRDLSCLGRFTPDVALNAKFWKGVVWPVVFTVAGPYADLTPLHCACVAWNGNGLLLAGESGSGKSTLSLALAQTGFDFLADDRILSGQQNGRMLAWNLSPEMKQRAEALIHFPALAKLRSAEEPANSGELRFDPAELPGVNYIQCCEPRWIIFLRRTSERAFALRQMSPRDAICRLEKDLHRQVPEMMHRQREFLKKLVERECYELEYGGNPHSVASALRRLVTSRRKLASVASSMAERCDPEIEIITPDPLRRFRSTPLSCRFLVAGKNLLLETDNSRVLEQAARFFETIAPSESAIPQFVWRIVTEQTDMPIREWPRLAAFSNNDVRYINLGQRGFIAVDLKSRKATGVLPEHLAKDECGFASVFLASLFYLTAPALDLVAITSACVAKGEKGLLLMGPPGSGKTTSSYWAKKLGLDFHADQAVFIERQGHELRAWGDFWPAAFRPEVVRTFPEISSALRPCHFWDRTFMCMPKSQMHGASRSVIPVACIFLEREPGTSPRLTPLSAGEVSSDYRPGAPFCEDAGSKSERTKVFQMLGRLPKYRLLYGKDSSAAGRFLHSILNSHQLMEDWP